MSIETYFRCDFLIGAAKAAEKAALSVVSGTAELSALSGFVTPRTPGFQHGSADADL
jgi:hypothetical protein